MGGTSTDVSLIAGEPRLTTESVVGGCPISIPMLDIHTIGAGGGSIAAVDVGGALRVGPQSAGADPGPACYYCGDLPTVTDANLVLGRMAAEHFLGGQMQLDIKKAQAVLAGLAGQMDLSPTQAALGVIEVVNAHMERALRVISVERGHDPREFSLLSFGGAGGLHAADLARRLGIPTVLISPLASTLSAFGMLVADVAKDYAQTVMLPGSTPLARVAELLRPMAERSLADIQAEGFAEEQTQIERLLDLRYQGQSYELTVLFSDTVIADFHAAHQRAYGYQRPDAPLEIVNLRVRAFGKVAPPELQRLPESTADPSAAILEERPVVLANGTQHIPFYQGTMLRPGNRIPGPSIILYPDTTVLIGHQDMAEVDGYRNLLIKVQAELL
jgi:N-methylhydantoinase A